MNGNPYTYCQNEPRVECKEDSDCSLSLACLNNRCQNPCYVLEPCNRPAACEVVSTLPVRTMICICPSGYISSGSGSCKAIPPVTDVACTADSQCPSDLACVNGICKNPCNCGPNAECFVKNNKPICSCVPGYEGNPNLECITGIKVHFLLLYLFLNYFFISLLDLHKLTFSFFRKKILFNSSNNLNHLK